MISYFILLSNNLEFAMINWEIMLSLSGCGATLLIALENTWWCVLAKIKEWSFKNLSRTLWIQCMQYAAPSCIKKVLIYLWNPTIELSWCLFVSEYLASAACFKRISVESCGEYYDQLIDHVSNPNARDDHICWYLDNLIKKPNF